MEALSTRLRALWEHMLDLILPPRERTLRMRSRSMHDLPLAPTLHEIDDIQVTTLLDYHAQETRDAIHTLKYDGSRRSAEILAEALSDHLREEVASMRAFSARPIILIPVPLHPSRLRERGFNQIERILRSLPSEFCDGTCSVVETRALIRERATPPQTRLSRTERLENVRDAFALKSTLDGAHIILIDDVVTTGATLSECVRLLRGSGAHVTAIALARA